MAGVPIPILVGAPVAMLGVMSTVSPSVANFTKRVVEYLRAYAHMIFTTESNFKGTLKSLPDPDLIKNSSNVQKVEMIFIRHGESEWNGVFNKDKGILKVFLIVLRLIRALFVELFCMMKGDSIFLDSPLNSDGAKQARLLLKFLFEGQNKKDRLVDVLSGNEGKSIIVSSNLRRCVETGTVALWGRLQRTKEKIHILSDLQEISRNVDTMALSPPMGCPPLDRLLKLLEDPNANLKELFETSGNAGQKLVFESAADRLVRFSSWCFDSPYTKSGENTIIVNGHSLYFKTFFNTFLPRNQEHDAKKKKIVNTGAVAFTFCRGLVNDTYVYRVDPESIKVIFGGFK